MHVYRVRTPVQLLSTRDERRQQQAVCQMENNVHVGLVPKFVTEIQEDKGPFDHRRREVARH